MRSSRSPVPRPWAARHRLRVAQTEPVELGGQRLVGADVDLVGRDDDRDVRAAQEVGQLGVARAQARARVDDEDGDLRVGQRGLRLAADGVRDRVGVDEVHAAGVDEEEAPAVPLRGHLVAVARDPGALVHDGGARAAEAVDQRGLPDVWDSRGSATRGVIGAPFWRASATIRSHDLVDRQARRVDVNGVRRGHHRAVLARGVAAVALGDLVGRQLAAARALIEARVEPDLELGVRRDHGADVAALGHPVPGGQQRALARGHRGADRRVGGAARRLARDLRGADRVGDVGAVEQHPAVVEGDVQRRRVAVAGQRDGAVHRPGVQVREAERVGHGARHGGLAGPGGPSIAISIAQGAAGAGGPGRGRDHAGRGVLRRAGSAGGSTPAIA